MRVTDPKLAQDHMLDIVAAIAKHKADVVAGRKVFGQLDISQYGVILEPHNFLPSVLRSYTRANLEKHNALDLDFVGLQKMIKSRVRSRLYYKNLVSHYKGVEVNENQ